MSSPSPSTSPPIPDQDPTSSPTPAPPSLPLPLSASLLLTSLPHDASAALATATAAHDDHVPAKVLIRFQPVGSAPPLRQKVVKVSSANRFETVVGFLSRKLAAADGNGSGGGVFCYVNSVFAPGLDEGVGGLWRCFKTDDQLIVAYAMTPAFG